MTTRECECGCGQPSTGEFLPGHDQRLRVALERRVGGLLKLRELIEATEAHRAGVTTEGDFGRQVRALLAALKT